MSVICFGELLIDFVSLEHGVTVGEASGFIKAPGGAPANVAVAVSRLGYKSAFMGQMGDDPFGHYLVDVLKADNIDVDGVTYSPDARTALAFVSLKADGDRSFMFYRHPSADMLMEPASVRADVISRYKIFHFGSITMIGEPSRSATLKALEIAQANKMFISYDPNLRLALWENAESAKNGMLHGFEFAHFVKVSEEEVEFLTGTNDPQTLWRDQMQLIVVTHGSQGATFYTRSQHQHIGGYRVKAVDTTGAGDSFVATILTQILANEDDYLQKMPEIVRFANAVGALTTQKKGAIPALPTRPQVDQFIQEHA
jgi:fructokinase